MEQETRELSAGQALQEAREARGLEIENISEELCISGGYFRDQLNAFASQLVTDNDPLATDFKDKLQTETGLLVAFDRIGWVEEHLRRQARDRAIPAFLEKHFVRSANGYQVRDEKFSKDLLEACRTSNEDIQLIQPVLRDIAQRVVEDSEENKLLKRFLEHDAAAVMLYFRELRSRLRPNAQTIHQRLAEFFVRIGDEFVLRSGNREEAEHLLQVFVRSSSCHRPDRSCWL